MITKDDLRADIANVAEKRKALADAWAKLETDRLDLNVIDPTDGGIDASALPPDGEGEGQTSDPVSGAADAGTDAAQGDGQGSARTPVIADWARVFVIVRPTDPMPAVDGSNAKTIAVPDEYGTIYCWPMSGPTFKTIDATHNQYSDGHATGQKFTFNSAATVKFVANPLNPSGGNSGGSPGTSTPPPPSTPATPTPMGPVATGPVEPGAAKDPAKMQAVLHLAEGDIVLNGANAIDLGDFTVPFAGIVQRNLHAVSPDGLWHVYFRPDRNSARMECVVLYGDPQNPNPRTYPNAYSVDFLYDGQVVGTVSVPYHFWLARWRWQSSPRPRVRRPSDLIAAKLSPPYGVTDITTSKLPGPAKPYTPMGVSSITPFIGQTGERGDIGINPEHHSAYMATEDATAYQSMMEWAEAGSTGPWHINDPATGGVFSFAANPDATIISNGTIPLHVQKVSEKDANGKAIYPDFIQPDDAHHPCTSYIPFITTGDPYHAEELQYQINYYLGGEAQPKGTPKTFIFDRAQTRGYAWMMRSVVDNYLAADLIQGATLLPKSYWKDILDKNLAWITANFVNAADGKAAWFSSGTSKTAMAWWQEDYLLCAIAIAVMLGLEDWRSVLQWKAKTDIARMNGVSGWDPSAPTLYFAQFVKQDQRPGAANAGNGTIQFFPISERSDQYDYLGEWQLQFTGPTDFNIFKPDGKPAPAPVKTGTVGVKTGSGYVPMFTVNAGSKPFAAGDVLYWTISKITDWKTLWDVNAAFGMPQSPPDPEYISHLHAAVTLAGANVPELGALLPAVKSLMQATGRTVTWRDSFVAPV